MTQNEKLALFGALLVGLVGAAVGCGGSGAPCAETTCKLGTCNPDDGSCVNASSCDGDDDCLAGYTCGSDGSCKAVSSCSSDGDCDRGICENGACVNPDQCDEQSDCVARSYCDTTASVDAGAADAGGVGVCKPDPCRKIRCPRGRCKPGTDRCVSKKSCSERTELRDCVSGENCLEGTCVPNDEFCERLTCDRGTCSLEEDGCVNSDNCETDADCVQGYFCNDMGQCKRNLCERDDVDCGGDGVCQKSSGFCENAESCQSNDECESDHLCVEGTCRHESSACGDAGGDGGCPGNQTCEYDDENLTVECEAPDRCTTTVDCKGMKRCNGRDCVEQRQNTSCSGDRFESNDSRKKATAFVDSAQERQLWGTVCSGDTDFYEVDTANLAGPAQRGVLVVRLEVPDRDRGLGEVEVVVSNDEGTKVGSASTGSAGADGVARVSKRVLIHQLGTYGIRVSPGDKLRKPGVTYQLSVELMPKKTVQACRGAQRITTNQRVSGSIRSTGSTELGSSCTSRRNPGGERIYRLDVERPQELTAEVAPESRQVDLGVSIREHCVHSGSELGCSAASGGGQTETVSTQVSPGSYFVVVQSPKRGSGGDFELVVRRELTSCAPSDNYCDGNGKAKVCTTDGARFRTVSCDNGCNWSRGRCVPPDGDICGTAPTITPMKAGDRTIPLDQANNVYQVGPGGCLTAGNTRSRGADVAYELEVPAKRFVELETTYPTNVRGSMYLVRNCSRIDDSCEQGVTGSTKDDNREVLQYSNTSNQKETFYLIIDTEKGQTLGTAKLSVNYEKVVCTPGAQTCQSGDATTCNKFGTKNQTRKKCGTLGCNSGNCVGETCTSPVTVPANGSTQTYSFNPNTYDDDYDISYASCLSDDSDDGEAVFEVSASKGDVIKVTWRTDAARLYMAGPGNCTSPRSNCVAGAEGNSSASITHTVQNAGSFYIYADRDNFGRGGQNTIDITVSSP